MTGTPTIPEFTIQRHFAAPIEQVFDAWVDPGRMAAWSGPTGSTVEVLDGSIAEGTTMHALSRDAEGGVMYTLTHYRRIEPPNHLVYEQRFADADGNVVKAPFFDDWPQALLTDIRFEADGDGTRLTLRWVPIDPTAAEIETFVEAMQSMTGGWSGSFDKLDQFLAA